MVATHYDAEKSNYRYVIQPNCSLTWRGTVLVFAAIAFIALAIGVWFALLGAWLVLPFAGIELTALGAAFYVCARRGHEREVIRVEGDTVAVERGRYAPSQRQEFRRAWASVHLRASRHRGHPSRLTISAHGRGTEIGQCLVEEERVDLAGQLRRAIAGGA